jgi:hypothetical protein
MPGPILDLSSTVMCAHGGTATPVVPNPRAVAAGSPTLTLSTTYVVAGCGLTGTGAPPCLTAQFTLGALRATSGGVPLLVASGVSICAPSGTPLVVVVPEPKVLAS